MPRSPIVKALLICDYVILDRDTGKNSFIGVFQNIIAQSFPSRHPPFWVVAMITDIEGKHDFEFALVNQEHSDGPNIVAQGTIRGLEFPSRHEQYTLRFQTGPIPLPNAGIYDLEFSCDGTLAESQTFKVQLRQPAVDGATPEPPSDDRDE